MQTWGNIRNENIYLKPYIVTKYALPYPEYHVKTMIPNRISIFEIPWVLCKIPMPDPISEQLNQMKPGSWILKSSLSIT